MLWVGSVKQDKTIDFLSSRWSFDLSMSNNFAIYFHRSNSNVSPRPKVFLLSGGTDREAEEVTFWGIL